ncbi:hypothetical protein [Microbacterium sp. MTN4-26]|uniref:hypothetical protein n=1 Tax=unclassified Microbacterium TaxID=2609290 RepID=UPI0036F258E4
MTEKACPLGTGRREERLVEAATDGLHAVCLLGAVRSHDGILASLHDQARGFSQVSTTGPSLHACYRRLHDLDLIARLVSRTQQVAQELRIDEYSGQCDSLGVDAEQ